MRLCGLAIFCLGAEKRMKTKFWCQHLSAKNPIILVTPGEYSAVENRSAWSLAEPSPARLRSTSAERREKPAEVHDVLFQWDSQMVATELDDGTVPFSRRSWTPLNFFLMELGFISA